VNDGNGCRQKELGGDLCPQIIKLSVKVNKLEKDVEFWKGQAEELAKAKLATK
jgi:hypothetical protein